MPNPPTMHNRPSCCPSNADARQLDSTVSRPVYWKWEKWKIMIGEEQERHRSVQDKACGLNGWIIGRSTFTKAQRGEFFFSKVIQMWQKMSGCGFWWFYYSLLETLLVKSWQQQWPHPFVVDKWRAVIQVIQLQSLPFLNSTGEKLFCRSWSSCSENSLVNNTKHQREKPKGFILF